jgi:hypothetical protein
MTAHAADLATTARARKDRMRDVKQKPIFDANSMAKRTENLIRIIRAEALLVSGVGGKTDKIHDEVTKRCTASLSVTQLLAIAAPSRRARSLARVEKSFRSNVAAVGQLEGRSRISPDLKNFLPYFLILRKLSHVVDGQHVGRRRPDFFQGFHFGMSRSFARLSINLLSFFADGPANPE